MGSNAKASTCLSRHHHPFGARRIRLVREILFNRFIHNLWGVGEEPRNQNSPPTW